MKGESIDAERKKADIFATIDSYVPTTESLKFISFIRAAGIEKYDNPPLHYMMGDKLFCPNTRYLLEECYRGASKSTIAEYAVIYSAVMGEWKGFGPAPCILFLGATADPKGNVSKFFQNIRNKIETSSFISGLIDVKRANDSEIELVNKAGVYTYVGGKGMSVKWRGFRSPKGDRPYILLADDVLAEDSRTSAAVREAVEDNWYGAALPALEPTHKIVFIGTPIDEKDLLHQLKFSGVYEVLSFPMCEAFPVPEEEYKSAWADKFTYEYASSIYKQYEAGNRTKTFYREYLLQAVDLSSRLVTPDMLKRFSIETLMKNKSFYNYYIVTDFATTNNDLSDYSAIGVFAVSHNNSWFLVDGQFKKQLMQKNLDDLFAYVRKWDPVSVGIETSGQQGGFLSILEEMMIGKGVMFSLAKDKKTRKTGIKPTGNKMERFVKGVQPKFEQGKIWLPNKDDLVFSNPMLCELIEAFEEELNKFTWSDGVRALPHDDALDLLNQLSEMQIFTPDAGPFIDDEKGNLFRDEKRRHEEIWGERPFDNRPFDNNNAGMNSSKFDDYGSGPLF